MQDIPRSLHVEDEFIGSGGCSAHSLEQAGMFKTGTAKRLLNAALKRVKANVRKKGNRFGPTRDGFGIENVSWHTRVILNALKKKFLGDNNAFTWEKIPLESLQGRIDSNRTVILDGMAAPYWRVATNPKDFWQHREPHTLVRVNDVFRHSVCVKKKQILDFDGPWKASDLVLNRHTGQPRRGNYVVKGKKTRYPIRPYFIHINKAYLCYANEVGGKGGKKKGGQSLAGNLARGGREGGNTGRKGGNRGRQIESDSSVGEDVGDNELFDTTESEDDRKPPAKVAHAGLNAGLEDDDGPDDDGNDDDESGEDTENDGKPAAKVARAGVEDDDEIEHDGSGDDIYDGENGDGVGDEHEIKDWVIGNNNNADLGYVVVHKNGSIIRQKETEEEDEDEEVVINKILVGKNKKLEMYEEDAKKRCRVLRTKLPDDFEISDKALLNTFWENNFDSEITLAKILSGDVVENMDVVVSGLEGDGSAGAEGNVHCDVQEKFALLKRGLKDIEISDARLLEIYCENNFDEDATMAAVVANNLERNGKNDDLSAGEGRAKMNVEGGAKSQLEGGGSQLEGGGKSQEKTVMEQFAEMKKGLTGIVVSDARLLDIFCKEHFDVDATVAAVMNNNFERNGENDDTNGGGGKSGGESDAGVGEDKDLTGSALVDDGGGKSSETGVGGGSALVDGGGGMSSETGVGGGSLVDGGGGMSSENKGNESELFDDGSGKSSEKVEKGKGGIGGGSALVDDGGGKSSEIGVGGGSALVDGGDGMSSENKGNESELVDDGSGKSSEKVEKGKGGSKKRKKSSVDGLEPLPRSSPRTEEQRKRNRRDSRWDRKE